MKGGLISSGETVRLWGITISNRRPPFTPLFPHRRPPETHFPGAVRRRWGMETTRLCFTGFPSCASVYFVVYYSQDLTACFDGVRLWRTAHDRQVDVYEERLH